MKQGLVIWITGLPASGKTTLALALQGLLREEGRTAILLDSDALRVVLAAEPDYSEPGRDRFYTALAGLAGVLSAQGVAVLVAATANRRRYREQARQVVGHLAVVYVTTPLAVCRERDPKGIYAAAAAGRAPDVPGLGAPFESPEEPDVAIDLTSLDPAAAARLVRDRLAGRLAEA